MKKKFSIILHVLLGIIILPILYLIFVSLLDTFYEAGGDLDSGFNVYISMALSITLSIIIPIRRYKKRSIKDTKNKKPVGIIEKISVITVIVLFYSALPMMVLYVAYPFLGGPVVTIIGLGWFVMVYIIFKHPKLVEKEMKRNAKYNIKN